MTMWNESEPVLECPCCRYPYQGTRCPNPGCNLNLSAAVKAARAERKRRLSASRRCLEAR